MADEFFRNKPIKYPNSLQKCPEIKYKTIMFQKTQRMDR
jgi:hypothetical protein